MKKILILIIVLLASALYFHDELKQIIPTPEVTIDKKELVERKEVYFKKFSEVPFTGKVTWKEEQGSFNNGKKEGSWVTYNSTGQLSKKESYVDGKKESPTVRYRKNGEILSIGNYKNGKKEGAWFDYKEDGAVNKDRTGTYKNGKKVSE